MSASPTRQFSFNRFSCTMYIYFVKLFSIFSCRSLNSCQIYVIHVNICYHYLFWLWAVIKAYIILGNQLNSVFLDKAGDVWKATI